MFLSIVQTLNARLAILDANKNSLLGGTGTLITANQILNEGNQEQDTIDVSSFKIFELFGFKTPEDMAAKLREISQHEGLLLAKAGVSDEALDKVAKLNPEFKDAAMKFKGTSGKKKEAKALAAASSFSPGFGTPGATLTPINNNASKTLLAPTSINEDKITPCGSGCDGNKARAEQVIADFNRINEGTFIANSDLGRTTSSALGKLTTAKNFYNPITNISSLLSHDASSSTVSREPASLSPAMLGTNAKTDANGNLIFDPTISISSNSAEFNPDTFAVAPEGWFSQEYSPGSGIIIRGALDRKFDKSNPNNPNNFVQIAITKDIRNDSRFKDTIFANLPPGVYTIKKCETGCVDHMYDNYAINLDNFNNSILKGTANENTLNEFLDKNKMLPGMIDAVAELQKLSDQTPNQNSRDILANIQSKNKENVAALQKSVLQLQSQNKLASGVRTTYPDHMKKIFNNREYFTYKHNKEYADIAGQFKNLSKEEIENGKRINDIALGKFKDDKRVVRNKSSNDPNLL